jgi:hypothetical protein
MRLGLALPNTLSNPWLLLGELSVKDSERHLARILLLTSLASGLNAP